MALIDIFSKGKKKEERANRPAKGALKRPSGHQAVAKEDASRSSEDKKDSKKEAVFSASNFAATIIVRPHITEKSSVAGESGIYTFVVDNRANKVMVRNAVKEAFGVVPEKVTVQNMPGKSRRVRGRVGTRPGFKKAVVFLKKGDKIEIS
jgi:large subunit ribosomal protein L23